MFVGWVAGEGDEGRGVDLGWSRGSRPGRTRGSEDVSWSEVVKTEGFLRVLRKLL